MNYTLGTLSGRLLSGLESDRGTLVHAVVSKPVPMRPCPLNDFGRIEGMIVNASVGVCGVRPGKRSVGWYVPENAKEVTCPRCLKKLGKK